MTLTAKFNGVCRVCGKSIAKGEDIEWNKGRGAKHLNCDRVHGQTFDEMSWEAQHSGFEAELQRESESERF